MKEFIRLQLKLKWGLNRNNNKRSAAMSAKMSGFNQEAFSNIQTIKAFDLIKYYSQRLRQLQSEYIGMRLEFQRMSIVTSIIMSIVGLLVSYGSYGWGIYRVFSGAISYGSMTMFLSLSGTLTGALNALISMVPSAIGLMTSATATKKKLPLFRIPMCRPGFIYKWRISPMHIKTAQMYLSTLPWKRILMRL